MEIISEVERSRRGVYTGSIGVVRADGTSDWNIAIRTAVWQDGEIRFGCGGGIVLDSDPECEYAEALLKAESFVESLHACAPRANAMST
jgi:para-aminobenzoate synthetase component 1